MKLLTDVQICKATGCTDYRTCLNGESDCEDFDNFKRIAKTQLSQDLKDLQAERERIVEFLESANECKDGECEFQNKCGEFDIFSVFCPLGEALKSKIIKGEI